MRSRGLPTTSYGYTPPRDARADGWRCFHDGCHRADTPAPRKWPARCPGCGSPVDPTFEAPWEHEAKGVLLAHELRTSARAEDRAVAGAFLHGWEYRDALISHDLPRQETVKARLLQVVGQLSTRQGARAFPMALHTTIQDATNALDLHFAADLLRAWHPLVRTEDVEDDNTSRTEARTFVGACICFLEEVGSIGHEREDEVNRVMRDVADRIQQVLIPAHTDGFDRIKRIRAKIAEVERIDRQDQARVNTIALAAPLPHPSTGGWAIDGLPATPVRQRLLEFSTAIAAHSGDDLTAAFEEAAEILSHHADEPTDLWAAVLLANAALLLADVHGDAGTLFAAADLLSARRGSPRVRAVTAGMAHLLRAHGYIALTHDREAHARAAESELDQAVLVAARPLVPAIRAVRGLLIVQRAQDEGTDDPHTALSRGISECLDGRNAVVRPWRKTSGADIALARLLVWRAFLVDEHPAARFADAREAVRLTRRWCGVPGPTSAQVVLNEALRAQDALAGGADPEKRAKNWRTAAARAAYAPTAMRMRLAVAWVAWAVENGDPPLVCEAYEHLMPLIPLEAAARYRPDAKEKVLGAAQEHTEEAGYWLARAGRYREAVVALETGRAISLNHLAGWDDADMAVRLERSGRSGLVDEYRAALAVLSTAERASTGAEGPDSPLQRAWAHARAVADRISEATGRHPLASTVDYADITKVNDDGAVIYIAAAKAAGYALVVAGGHDPQYIHLPDVNRDAVAEQSTTLLPGPSGNSLNPFTLTHGLRWLAENGIRDILLWHARGRVVTLVPIGLLSLLPLHAASDRKGNHVGDFSAIRYAPNVRTLLRCRESARALSDRPLRLLAVNVPDGHGMSEEHHLKHVARETAEIGRIWATRSGEGLVVDDCTWEEFRRTADDYSVWHIACHGSSSPHGPLGSTISFADAEVTLGRMTAELRSGPRRLAVLSACESHLTGAAVPNEVVGLPTVLLQLGFSGVIATAWEIDDVATTYLMTHFYRSWSTGEVHPAVALNRAQTWLRTATANDLATLLPDVSPAWSDSPHPYANPYYWAAFAYTGA